MKKALFCLLMLFISNIVLAQIENASYEVLLDTIRSQKTQLADKEKIINNLKGQVGLLTASYNRQVRRYDEMIKKHKTEMTTLERSIARLRKDSLTNQTTITELTQVKSTLASENYKLTADVTNLRQTSDEAIAANEIALAEKDRELSIANEKLRSLTIQLANVIDRKRKLVIFNGQTKDFGEDVIFFETKSDISKLTLSQNDIDKLNQFIMLANRTPQGIKIVVVGKYIRGENTEIKAEERAKNMCQLLRNNQLNVPIDFDTEVANNNANYEKIGVSICVKKTW